MNLVWFISHGRLLPCLSCQTLVRAPPSKQEHMRLFQTLAGPSVTFLLLTSPLEGEGAPEELALPTQTEKFHHPP